jgi:hypothetical protein
MSTIACHPCVIAFPVLEAQFHHIHRCLESLLIAVALIKIVQMRCQLSKCDFNCPHAAMMSFPLGHRTVTLIRSRPVNASSKALIVSRDDVS